MQEQRLTLGTLLAAVTLAVLSALLCVYHLKDFNINTEPAARAAVYARDMNAEKIWLAPKVDGAVRLDQPPLFLWAVKLTSGLDTQIEEYHPRVPGAVAAVLTILLVGAWFFVQAQRYGRDDAADVPPAGFALLAGLMFASCPLTVLAARSGTPVAFEMFFYLAAAFCWGESLEARRSFYAGRSWKQWLGWGYLFAILAVLAGGLIPLLLLAIPYFLSTRSYRLTRLNPLHLLGMLLLVAVTGGWLFAAGGPAAGQGALEWLLLRAGMETLPREGILIFLVKVLLATFPWNLIAGAMLIRIWRRQERSPTLVFWMWSLLVNLPLLAILSPTRGTRMLPIVVFVTLLAMQALLRWNFEVVWASRLRKLLRVALGVLIAFGLFLATTIDSTLGLVLFILLPLGWLFWMFNSRSNGIIYTVWETTVRLSALTVLFAILAQVVIVSDFTPRRRYLDRTVVFFNRLKHHLDRNENIHVSRVGEGSRFLFDYYLGHSLEAVTTDTLSFANAPATTATQQRWVVTQGPLESPALHSRAIKMAGEDGQKKTDEGLNAWRVFSDAELSSAGTPLAARAPLRVAILGNAGTRHRAQRDVAHRMGRYDRQHPIEDVLLAGNNIYGSSIWRHLDFIETFEVPYKRLLKDGVAFHAALGHEESRWARTWLQSHYPPFHMDGERYYVTTLGGGLVDCFMLDSTRLHNDGKFDQAQWEWLEKSLGASKAPWRVVCLWRAIHTSGDGHKADKALADRLLPLLDRFKVQAVFQSGGQWYEHIELPGHAPKIFNVGWSGEIQDTTFLADPNSVKQTYNAHPGFVIAEFTATQATVRAITSKGVQVDETRLDDLTAPITPPSP